ncbi:MAG: DsbA family protein [Candidatus Jorgensenbacteria bacterium]|nr:DsbA family protein [Candidatus Jorgensenbacteria bacterium]
MDEPNLEGVLKKRDVLLPASIIIAGVLVAGAVIWSVGKRAENPSQTAGQNIPAGPNIAAMRAVDSSDHVRGSRDAKVTIVEYSDFECPFCQRFHPTMQNVLATYGNDVAWVYRHFPIASLHAKAKKEAEASECVAELGGNDAFWKFADRIFEVTPANDGLDPAELPRIAEYAGVLRAAFESCLASGKYGDMVNASVNEVEALGIRGTPYVVFDSKGDVESDDFPFLMEINTEFARAYPNQPAPFTIDESNRRIGMSGAFPLEMVKQIVETLMRE